MRSLCDIRAKIRLAVLLFPFITVGYGVSKRCAINVPEQFAWTGCEKEIEPRADILSSLWYKHPVCLNQKQLPTQFWPIKTIIPVNLHLSKCIGSVRGTCFIRMRRLRSQSGNEELDSNAYYMCNANLAQYIRENINGSLTAGEKHLVMKWPVGREMQQNISNMLSSLSWMEDRLTPAVGGLVPTHLRQHN